MTSGLIHERVTAAAAAVPDRVAVAASTQLTYGDLDQQSTQLAHVLRSHGCQPGDRVAFLLPKTPKAITVMLGILKAGCVYVPLDPAGPIPRLQRMLRLCDASLVIGDATGLKLLGELTSAEPTLKVGWLEGDSPTGDLAAAVLFGPADVAGESDEPIPSGTSATAPAYILFTSGSTGVPKGVVISHANVGAFLDWAVPHYGIGPSDRVSAHSPLHFDLSVFDIFGALSAGATVHPVDPLLNLLPHQLVQFMRDKELTQWFSVPSLLAYIASHDVVTPDDLPTLRRLLWCGEVMPTAALQYWMERLRHVSFTNLYGPTETTIASSHFDVQRPPADLDRDVPIGVACSGEQLIVLDEELREVDAGQVGEICIGGAGLSTGYWRDPERTAAAFVEIPHYGRVYRTGDMGWIDEVGLAHFSGRRDSQIKTRGYRVELGDIVSALSGLAAIRECTVVAIDSQGFEGKMICCAYVPATNQETPATIRRRATSVLPRYMIPHRWLEYDLLPRNAAGKIDQSGIRARFEEEYASDA